MANQILHRRDRAPKGETRRARRDRTSRESRLRERGSQEVGPAPAGATWVDVCDRGADVFEYIEYKHVTGGPFIVRSKYDRLCRAPDGARGWRRAELHAHARRLEPIGPATWRCRGATAGRRDGPR